MWLVAICGQHSSKRKYNNSYLRERWISKIYKGGEAVVILGNIN